jgi:hypothetical protein
MNTTNPEAALEDLITETLRRARLFVSAIKGTAFYCSAREASFITRCLAALGDGSLMRQDTEGALQAIRDILCREIAKETLEMRRVFDGYHDPEFGDLGRVREIPVWTDRGEALADVLAGLDALIEARERAFDRLRAEQEVRRLV